MDHETDVVAPNYDRTCVEDESQPNLCASGEEVLIDDAQDPSAGLVVPLKEKIKTAREDQKDLIKRTLLVVPGTMLGYWLLEVGAFWVVRKYAPNQMVWARRSVEMAHSIISFLNASRGALAGGKIKIYDYVWSVELGYYFYELSKVKGMDMMHHLVSIWSYVSLLIDVQQNKDTDSCERRNFYHSLIMMGLHFAEPWKDISRSISNRTIKNFIWIFHHFAYSFRIILWPFLMVMNNKTKSLDKYTLLNAPLKCTVGSVIFFLMNIYWFWLKLRKFSFPE